MATIYVEAPLPTPSSIAASMASSISSRKPSEIFKAQAQLYNHMYGMLDTMCLKWCIEMNIPNIIHNHGQPISLSKLVSTLQVPSTKFGNVQRLMHYLAHIGFFEIISNQQEEAYALTVVTELLVQGTDLCLSPMVEGYLNPTISGSYNHLKKWIYEEDLTLFDVTLGSDFWKFLNQNPENNRSFNAAMASDSKMINLVLKDYGVVFDGLESVVDVGGGNGTMENLSGDNNLTYVGGDMFTSVPKADAVVLKWILHDWTDEDCIKILEKCKEAITSDEKVGKVILMEIVMNEKKDDHQITQVKMQMDVNMACVNGKERNEEEWKKLFVEAGFKDYKISPLTELLSIIEIYP
ncbi:Isoflavone-7-O-methyltransferase 9 [Lathyrus oleraceus]|uniref:Isoflavone-7-O-methyltransferase 9 n=1 Tax=Pisum sativum TaxID=3888 RepID=A0A9D4Y3H2_PEA|nr:Isoflavone-7-O-methyltransferase 9 [Pisum sativum]